MPVFQLPVVGLTGTAAAVQDAADAGLVDLGDRESEIGLGLLGVPFGSGLEGALGVGLDDLLGDPVVQAALLVLAEALLGGLGIGHGISGFRGETRTILRHRTTDEPASLNFAVGSKLQRKFSPLYAKRIAADWHARTLAQLPNYVDHPAIELFRRTSAPTVAAFCLAMYRGMGLLDGVEVVCSSDPAVRRRACDVDDFFVDVPYEGEIVRARVRDGWPGPEERAALFDGEGRLVALAGADGDETLAVVRGLVPRVDE